MILSDIFQRFVQDSPVTVMTQAILENALPPATVDEFSRTTPIRSTRGSCSSPMSWTS